MVFSSKIKNSCFLLFSLFIVCILSSCGGGGGGSNDGINLDSGVFGPDTWGTPDTFRGAGVVRQEGFLFGGPISRGRVGDILLQNDKVRVIIQKPGRSAGVGMFGGYIIDADRFRPSSEPGQDQFGVLFPLINIGWTVNYQRLEIINGDFANGPVIVRATGVLDVYDYIQTNIITALSKVAVGVDLTYPESMDDLFNPFLNGIQRYIDESGQHIAYLKDFSPVIVTDYTLAPDASYVIMETKFQNNGEYPLKIPVGDWVNGSGTLELFVPRSGFVRTTRVSNASGLVYQALEDDVGVSYGYFYNPVQFAMEDGTLPAAAALSVSGVTPMVLGEEDLLNVIPLGDAESKVRFQIDPGVRSITRYFVVGTGDVASVLDEAFKALGISKLRLSGTAVDSNGKPVERARIVVMDNGKPVTSAFSAPDGSFAMDISSGTDAKDQLFGSGTYTIEIYKEGYHLAGTQKSGKCTGGNVDSGAKTVSGVQCTLGASGQVTLTVDSDGEPGPARVMIVGFDPSPPHGYYVDGSANYEFGKYQDINLAERPYGVVDLLYIDPSGEIFPQGNPRMLGPNTIRLEPGEYEIFFMRGMEYSIDHHRITVAPGGSINVSGSLAQVVDTSGYVSGDFHVHGINSPDSPYRMESRVRSAMAEGLDILVGTDHEYLTDYLSVAKNLGYDQYMTAFVGDEITPLSYGHMIVWPLTTDKSKPDNGAYDYTYLPSDDILNPNADFVQSIGQVLHGVDQTYPGTQVLSVAHITDYLGNFSIAQLVTSPAFGLPLLSSFADPVRFRLPPNTNAQGNYQAPFPLGTSETVTTDFTSLGLTIGVFGTFKNKLEMLDHLLYTSLPTYFNILNMGKKCSATGDTDTHTQMREPTGIPRNFIISSVDPRNGVGTFDEIDSEEIAQNVNAGKVVVTNGIFIRAKLKSASNQEGVTVGGTIAGTGDVTLEMEITSNEFFDWDIVEIYANTEPVPAKDDLSGGTDLGAEEFHTRTQAHTSKYLMDPLIRYQRGDVGETALNQTVANGVRKAVLSKDFHFTEDTWIVIVARGSSSVRSAFPYVTKSASVTLDSGGNIDPSSPTSPGKFLDTLDNDPANIGGVPAWAFTNPIYVDIDGNGWQGIYQANGTSPLH